MKDNLPEKPTYEALEQRVQSLEQELAHLRHIQQALTGSEQNAHDASLELSIGLYEVFETLVAMSLGDPHARVSEESSLEMMAKLKRHVNRTAENLEEIVTLSHEFAMGLAEHFDVLHRVSQGDLEARVTGTSSVELLEALKNVTNKMIESVSGGIAKRKHMEEALQTERERLFSLLDGLPMYVYLQGRDHTIRFANRRFKEHFGVPDNRPCYEVIGSTDRPCAACRPFTVFDTGKPLEWEWQRRNGKTYQIYDYPFTDTDGTPLILELGIDITERKRAQRERQAMEEQFHQAQKMEALGILAGSIVHDFNNLLMVIQSDASMMLMNAEPDDPNCKRLKNIQQEVRNGARLLEQLLGFARIKRSEVKPTHLNDLVKRTCDMFAGSKSEITIKTGFQEDLWTAQVDSGQIEQVLLNLFINAADAMPAGGELRIGTSNAVLDKRDVMAYKMAPGNYVKITVKDTGVGMDEETRQRAFEPFFTTKEEGRGTGLGLASTYGIIKNHGGIITVESEKGKGAQFDIYLPASPG